VIFEVAWRECVKCGEEKDSKEVVTILKVTFLAAEKKLPMGL
jgi:Zn ribbon nucleic-acid-binding protein